MYLKQLLVIKNGVILRNINFHKGLNLIIDETKEEGSTTTGNNVGKTTVLKLIYFCFGGDPKEIYTSTENAKDEYPLIKEFLTNNNVEVRLTLKEDLNVVDSKEIVIERNFLKRSKSYRKINGEKYTEKEFTKELRSLIFNDLESDKPTLKQLVGHNIRYKDSAISNTIKYLAPYTKDVEYEALYLYLLGCSHKKGQKKEELLTKLKQEEKFKRRLELSATKNDYAIMLAAVNNNIETLDKKRSNLNINENFEEDLNTLNRIKSDINQLSEGISLLEIRKDLINESKNELEKNNVDIDLVELKLIYEEVSENLSDLNKTFSDLVRISGLSHGTDVWLNNAQYFIKEGYTTLRDCIATRDDIMVYLMYKGVAPKTAFTIMESVRKGKGLTEEFEKTMKENNVEDWYIESCKRIKYMFPKAHAVAYVLSAIRVAWWKLYYPREYYAVYFSTRCDFFDIETLVAGKDAILSRRKEIEMLRENRQSSNKDEGLWDVFEIALEMIDRGFHFSPLNLEKSDANKFILDPDDPSGLLPPFSSVDSLGESVANTVIEARKHGSFLSKEDVIKRTKLNNSHIKQLTKMGVFDGMQEENQLSLF